MFLAAGDIFWRWFHYPRWILAFKLDVGTLTQSSTYVAHLKNSLALALVEFYPLAGRIFEQPDGCLALNCNDAGVPFSAEAFVDIPFSSLETTGFHQYQPFFEKFAPLGNLLAWTNPDLPLLSVQVTRFASDDGLVIGVGHSHMVADGSSFWHFLKSWAECAKGLPVSMRPLHMRTALGPERLILPPATQADYASGCSWPTSKSITQGGKLNIPPCNSDQLVQRDFHFSADMVKKLKAMAVASADPEVAAQISSLQALSAHIWKRVAAARATVNETFREVAFFLIADMRSRIVPPLPDAYFGNAVLRGYTTAPIQDLQEESIGRTAMRVLEIVRKLDDKEMKTFLGKIEVLDPQKVDDGMSLSLPSLQVSSSPRFPVYELDFGWGTPLCVRSLLIRTNGEMMWYTGPKGGGSVDVALALDKPAMEQLELDQDFLSISNARARF